MLRTLFKVLVLLLAVVGVLLMFTITIVDRVPYKQTDFYSRMDARLDSLANAPAIIHTPDTLEFGWAKVSIMPFRDDLPLAGYGKREPKTMSGIHDSVFVRTVAFQKGPEKAAFITADLLIIHPELSRKVQATLPDGWRPENIYFTATHTHSGLGGWAPGTIGKFFAGSFDAEIVDFLAKRITQSIRKATEDMSQGLISYIEFSEDNLIMNRLAGAKGNIDPWLKVLQLQNSSGKAYLTFFGAHATCMGSDFHQLSGDYPARLVQLLEGDPTIQFAAFSAGAVGSMAPSIVLNSDLKEVEQMAQSLNEQIELFDLLGGELSLPTRLRAYQLPVSLRDPYFKVTKNLSLRPYLFHQLFGEYQVYIRVLEIGKTLMIGVPCDFSGELAMPLYEKARKKGLNLVITSFSGEYIGYVIKDEWYDLPKYESRTMSWYGPDIGSYFSEIVNRIINASNTH